MRQDQNEKLWELIKDMRTGMLVTQGRGFMHARPMALLQKDLDDGILYFFTSKESAKMDEVEAHSEVCVTFCEQKDMTFVSLTGNVTLSEDRAKIHELWTHESGAYFDGKDDPELIILEIKIEKAEYWDVTASRMVQIYEFIKGNITGEYPDLGENKKLG